MTFDEWFDDQKYHVRAEDGWNAALDEAIKLCEDLETQDSYIIALCLEKLKND